MANSLNIKIHDRTKAAIAREAVALCGLYDVSVEPAFSGEGKLVIYRSYPNIRESGVARVYPGENTGTSNFDVKNADWGKNPVYAVFDMVDGKTVNPLDLGVKSIVEDYTAQYAPDTMANLRFAVYSNDKEGLLGSGEFMLKVVEPYRAADDQDFCNWRGAKGEDGKTPKIEIGTVEDVGPKGTPSAKIRKKTDEDGKEIDGEYVLDLKLKQGPEGFFSTTKQDDDGNFIGVTALVIGTRAGSIHGALGFGSITLNEAYTLDSVATGEASIAAGNGSEARGASSLAMGTKCYAYGNGCIAIGHNCESGEYNSDRSGSGAFGEGCIAYGSRSFSFGWTCKVYGNSCAAMGQDNTIGEEGDAILIGAFACGAGNVVKSNYAHAEGYGNKALGYASHVEGGAFSDGANQGNAAKGTASHVEGLNNESGEEAKAAHVEGQGNNAQGVAAHAEGQGNNAGGLAAHVQGIDSTANGECATSIGAGCDADGERAVAIGTDAKANDKGSVVISAKSSESSRLKEVRSIGEGSVHVRAEGDIELYSEGLIRLTANSSGNSADRDYVDFIKIGDMSLRDTIKKYAQITEVDFPVFSFTRHDERTNRITLKYKNREEFLDFKDAVLTPYAQVTVAGDWDIDVGDIDEVAGEDVTCRVDWIDENSAEFEGRVGWHISECFFTAQLKDQNGDDGIYDFYLTRPLFISDDENLDSFEASVETYCHYYNFGHYLNVPVKAKRDVCATKGEPFVTKSYVDKKVAEAGNGGGEPPDLSDYAKKEDLNDYLRKEKDGGLVLSQKFDEYGSTIPCLVKVTDSVVLGQPSDAGGDEALLKMTAAGRSGGFRVFVAPHFNDDGSETETSQTVVSIDDISDVGLELRKISVKRDKADNIAAASSFTEWECFPSEREGKKISIVKLTDEFGKPFYLPKIGGSLQDAQSLEDHMTEYTWKANENWICDFDLTAIRKVVTKTDEPYVTPTGVKNIAIPKYEFVDAAIADGKVTVAPYTNAKLKSDGTAFSVAVAEGDGKTRDCVLRVECGETAPKITWGANFHPRTDAETDFKCEAGKRNVYWISEYAEGEFCVAGWQETTGGNAS